MVTIKKALAYFLVVTLSLLMVAFLAKGSMVEASGTQQTAESVELTLVTYFDSENTITTEFEIPEVGSQWFNETSDLLFEYTSEGWDSGTSVPVSEPVSPETDDMWFDESVNKLYTYLESDWDSGVVLPTMEPDLKYGEKLSLNSSLPSTEGYTFLFWEVNGSIRYYEVDHVFTLAKTNVIKAVFSPTDKHAVVFVDANSEILEVEYVANNGTATPPETLPSKPGYTTNGWSVSYETVTDDVVTVLQYTATNTTEYAVSVINGTGDDDYTYNTVATITADTPEEGYYFHHWETEDLTVSYEATYSFTVLKAVEMTAYYATSAPADLPRVAITNDIALREGYKTFVGQFYLPSGYTLIEYGIVSTPSATAMVDIDSPSVVRNQATKYNSTTNEYVLSIVDGNSASYRGYMVCEDSEENIVTVYSESAYNVVNGGFETGNMYGWNAYGIWKNESGLQAYVDQPRVVNDTYFGSNPYNRDGTYNLGIVWTNAAWDQSAERMGHLRSSDFVLGGSGWVSFKLGGGRTSSFAYVSVRKTSDNTEVARFGNKNYNNTGIASTQYGSSITNAEAFMFQYYYDLSSVGSIGESYYFVISDTSSWEWCILSADSFITYYPTAPSTSEDTLATNIVPVILLAGSAANSIPNGNFDSNIDNWTNVDGYFYYDSQKVRSSSSSMGVFRSSAFKVVDGSYEYLRFGWGGALYLDKQIFLSIKEVGTNIEVMRIVRRNDLSSKDNDNMDNHMVNLSSLDPTKEYYLEFADNKTDKRCWIDSVLLVDLDGWNEVISPHPGDEAVYISGINTDFTYQKP